MQRVLCLLPFFAFIASIQLFAESISISNQQGTVIEVDLLQVEDERIQIRLAGGQEIWYAREQLSAESQALIAEKAALETNQFKELNELLGVPLFNDAQLWDDSAKSIAKRLGWPRESETKQQSSFRKYPKAEYRLLKCRPYSAVLYGNEGKASHLSIVFANKGDFKFSPVPTEREISDMERAIDKDVDQIKALLTRQLGDPDRQMYGAGRGIKQLIMRWDWNEHAFLLASQDGEYASLKIVPTAVADEKGRGEKLSDASLRALTVENLVTRPNGDVIISNIPMVNQGPKGYCVPATFERYLRYVQIPADMYILAMAGQTQIGGGTSVASIIASLEGYIASQNRSLKQYTTSIDVRTIKKHIDKGLPVMWTMYSSPEYNKYASSRSKLRAKVNDWEVWEKSSRAESRDVDLVKDVFSGHVCMIIGYNKETDEIAVSDSWGPSFEERWISADQAEQVSQGSIYLIGF